MFKPHPIRIQERGEVAQPSNWSEMWPSSPSLNASAKGDGWAFCSLLAELSFCFLLWGCPTHLHTYPICFLHWSFSQAVRVLLIGNLFNWQPSLGSSACKIGWAFLGYRASTLPCAVCSARSQAPTRCTEGLRFNSSQRLTTINCA